MPNHIHAEVTESIQSAKSLFYRDIFEYTDHGIAQQFADYVGMQILYNPISKAFVIRDGIKHIWEKDKNEMITRKKFIEFVRSHIVGLEFLLRTIDHHPLKQVTDIPAIERDIRFLRQYLKPSKIRETLALVKFCLYATERVYTDSMCVLYIRQFLELKTDSADNFVGEDELHRAFVSYWGEQYPQCKLGKEPRKERATLGVGLRSLGYSSFRDQAGNRVWKGLRLVENRTEKPLENCIV
jgi:hypothetical protein